MAEIGQVENTICGLQSRAVVRASALRRIECLPRAFQCAPRVLDEIEAHRFEDERARPDHASRIRWRSELTQCVGKGQHLRDVSANYVD